MVDGVHQEKTKVLCTANDPKNLTVFEQLIFIIKFHRHVKHFLDKYEGNFECPKPNIFSSLFPTTPASIKLQEIYKNVEKIYSNLDAEIEEICQEKCDIKTTIMELIDEETAIEILKAFHNHLVSNTIPSDEKEKKLFEKWFDTIKYNSPTIRSIYIKYCKEYTITFYKDLYSKFYKLLEKSKCKKTAPIPPTSETENEQSSTPQQGGKRRKTRQRRLRRRNVTLKRRHRQKKYHRR